MIGTESRTRERRTLPKQKKSRDFKLLIENLDSPRSNFMDKCRLTLESIDEYSSANPINLSNIKQNSDKNNKNVQNKSVTFD